VHQAHLLNQRIFLGQFLYHIYGIAEDTVHHTYQYLFDDKVSSYLCGNIYAYKDVDILISYHTVHYTDHDHMAPNINEYIEGVYIYKHKAKWKNVCDKY
jgi:hypothetical protein